MTMKKEKKLGLVIGKFMPLHRGHRLLIDTARAGCDELVIAVTSDAWHTIPVERRVGWLRAAYPEAEVVIIDQMRLQLPAIDPRAWAQAAIDALGGRAPDVVFSSEDYGPPWAAAMGAEHVLVDRSRERVPISATMIRSDPQRYRDYLPPHVRDEYTGGAAVG